MTIVLSDVNRSWSAAEVAARSRQGRLIWLPQSGNAGRGARERQPAGRQRKAA